MRQLLVFAAVVAVVAAGSSGDVDEALLARVAQILGGSSSGGGSSRGFGGGSSASAFSAYSAPSGPSSSYGAPSGGASAVGRSAGRNGGSSGVQIGSPERAQRVAEFELSSGGNAGGRSGPSSSYGAPSEPSNQYGAPDGAIAIGRSAGSSGAGGIQIGSPERAQRVAEFELSGGNNGGSRGALRNGGGYN